MKAKRVNPKAKAKFTDERPKNTVRQISSSGQYPGHISQPGVSYPAASFAGGHGARKG